VNLHQIILDAKLGSARKDAQIDTCTVFAAALYDLLPEQGIVCKMVAVEKRGLGAWAHSVVEVDGRYYDSMGEFSVDIYRTRAKIHPKVELDIQFRPDSRHDCFESDFDEMYTFYVKMLSKSLYGQAAAPVAA